ncbi:helix-turn-helix domain-containing protein [Chitinibacteraceae bacterium HSL-7]
MFSEALKQITTHPAILGAVLTTLRTRGCFTQTDLAQQLELTASTWSRIEKGESSLSVEQLRKAAGVLGTTPAQILMLADSATAQLIDKGITVVERFSDADERLLTAGTQRSATTVNLLIERGVLPLAGSLLVSLVTPLITPP